MKRKERKIQKVLGVYKDKSYISLKIRSIQIKLHPWQHWLKDIFPEKFCLWFAWRVPRKIVYWCTVRAGAEATTGKYSHKETPSVTILEVLDAWPKGKK